MTLPLTWVSFDYGVLRLRLGCRVTRDTSVPGVPDADPVVEVVEGTYENGNQIGRVVLDAILLNPRRYDRLLAKIEEVLDDDSQG